MNQTVFLSELRKICLVVIAYCAGKGWLSAADSSLIGGLIPAVGLLAGPWLWGLYSMVNMKLVPHDSIAISGDTALAVDKIDAKGNIPSGATITQLANTAKVVGSLLLAIILASFMFAPAYAQGMPRKLTGNVMEDFANAQKPSMQSAPFDNAVQGFNDGVQKIEKAIVDRGIADLQAAIKDATEHDDKISLPCWKANLALLQSLPSQWPEPPSLPMGIALSIQVQRDLMNTINGNDEKSLKVACAALWGDQLKIVAKLGALLGIRIATGGLL